MEVPGFDRLDVKEVNCGWVCVCVCVCMCGMEDRPYRLVRFADRGGVCRPEVHLTN